MSLASLLTAAHLTSRNKLDVALISLNTPAKDPLLSQSVSKREENWGKEELNRGRRRQNLGTANNQRNDSLRIKLLHSLIPPSISMGRLI
jgi:hypothetical protein